MNSVAIISPSVDWGVLPVASALQIVRKKYGHKTSLTICGATWCDDALQHMLPGRPDVITVQEMSAKTYDMIISLTDSIVNAQTARLVGAVGLVANGCSLQGTSEHFDHLSSCYRGECSGLFNILARCLGFEGDSGPVFFPSFEPKMHERQGVSIKDGDLRSAVKSSFFDTGRLWHVPLRKSIAKRIEEARTVSALVTDDPICAWACASGGGRSILLRRAKCVMPSFGEEGMVDEEFVDLYDKHRTA
jgi:hypothetical protein